MKSAVWLSEEPFHCILVNLTKQVKEKTNEVFIQALQLVQLQKETKS